MLGCLAKTDSPCFFSLNIPDLVKAFQRLYKVRYKNGPSSTAYTKESFIAKKTVKVGIVPTCPLPPNFFWKCHTNDVYILTCSLLKVATIPTFFAMQAFLRRCFDWFKLFDCQTIMSVFTGFK